MLFKKIGLFSAHSFERPGGVQNHVLGLYKEFERRGFEVKIIAPGSAKPQGIPQDDVITIGITKYIPANQSQAEFSVSIRKRFRVRIWEENFDILHFHNLGFGPLSYQILRHSNALHVLTVHAASDGSTIPKIPFVKQMIRYFYELRFHGLIAVSPAAMNTVRTFGGFHNGLATIIPNGLDISRFKCGVSDTPHNLDVGYPIPHMPHITLLFVGRLEKRKGLLDLLRAYKLLISHRRNPRLKIVGDGEQQTAARKFVGENHLSPFVEFVGSVSDEVLPALYQSADIFCAPSLRGESFGMTLLEAMACGTPVVGFANPGYSYVMNGHEDQVGTSLLVKPGDCEALAEKILLLLNDMNVYARARNWGLERVQEFTWPRVADQILRFYEEAYEWRERKITTTIRM